MFSEFVAGNNFSIYLDVDKQDEATRIFNDLHQNGNVIMPIETQVWRDYFGMLADKCGIICNISYSKNYSTKKMKIQTTPHFLVLLERSRHYNKLEDFVEGHIAFIEELITQIKYS